MPYTESPDRSAEILRLVLPRIAKHGGHYAPPSYCVWYEHLAGINAPLSAALECHLRETPRIELSAMEQLYAKHVQGRDVHRAEQLQAALGELVRRLAAAATTSGAGVEAYAKVLAASEQALGSVNDADSLQRMVRSLVDSTASARDTTETLRAEVEATKNEVETLRGQLSSLQGEALVDPLTGLRNRRGFDKAVADLFGERQNSLTGAALLLADIDHFKRVNDTYGHLFGDQVIRACAQVLTGAVKGRDVASRFGGEEFLILLPDTAASGALALAEQIRTTFGQVRIRRGGTQETGDPVTISIGVAVPAPGESLEQAIDRADQALYQAKSDGRNCVRVAAFGRGAVVPSSKRDPGNLPNP